MNILQVIIINRRLMKKSTNRRPASKCSQPIVISFAIGSQPFQNASIAKLVTVENLYEWVSTGFNQSQFDKSLTFVQFLKYANLTKCSLWTLVKAVDKVGLFCNCFFHFCFLFMKRNTWPNQQLDEQKNLDMIALQAFFAIASVCQNFLLFCHPVHLTRKLTQALN